MALHNPNNWHWVDKNVLKWTKEWLESTLLQLSAEKDDVEARISKVITCDGDVTVSQRKGKVITYYDVKLVLEYTGSAPDEDSVSGTITIPEIAHDTEEDEFVFETDIYSDSKTKQPVKDLVRAQLVPMLRKTLPQLTPALVAHGKILQHADGEDPSAAFPAAKLYPQTGVAVEQSAVVKEEAKEDNVKTEADDSVKLEATDSVKKEAIASVKKEANGGPKKEGIVKIKKEGFDSVTNGHAVDTATVTDQEEFRTTAEQLYLTFTDPQRLAAFTRAPPRVFEGAEPGCRFELFDGNVSGKYVELEAPTHIVQTWRLKQWPENHYSELRIDFDQNDVDGVTVMRVKWFGVPAGQEEVTKRNWKEYYVRSIKLTFG